MNRLLFTTRNAVVLLSFALWNALSFSALAVNLNNGEARINDGASAVDTASYRSSSGRHKVLIESVNTDRAKSVQAIRTHNYGSFQVLEVSKATADRLIASGIASNADGHNLILFNTGAVDTTSPAVLVNRSKALNMSSGKQLHLVQFPGPIKPEWYAQLESTGVEIVSAIPSNAYLVYGDPIALNNVAALTDNGVAQWQGAYLSGYKLQPGTSPDTKTNAAKSLVLGPPDVSRANLYQVQLVRDPSTNALTEAIFSALPAVSRYEIKNYVNLVVTIAPELLDQVAKRPDVISIAKYIEPRLMDERQAMILAGELTGNVPNPGNYFTKLSTWGLTQAQFTASSVVVDVTDDGVDRNPIGVADPGTVPTNSSGGPVNARHFLLYQSGSLAAASRYVYKGVWGTLGTDAGLGKSGHGQLNMSIIGGYVPDAFDPSGLQVHRDAQGFRYGLGIAPFVKLGNSVIFDPAYTNPNFANLLSNAYGQGARISSNSWGANTAGAYNADAQAYDILVRDSQSLTGGNQQMLAVFSAGNAGPGASTVGAPGTGKNVLTVGAGENVRSHALAAGGAGATGADGCAIDDTGADSANDIISFSSRGPTADGRKKPDIVAPGTHVTGMTLVAVGQDPLISPNYLGAADATYRADGVCGMPGGRTAGNVNDFFPLTPAQKWYTTSSGTSHSAPAVAGSAALIYQQFLNNPGYLSANRTPGSGAPSPALVKAYLTNSARYMTGANAFDTLPSNNQGMGSVNLGTAFDGVQRIIRDQDATDRFTASGQVRSYFATVASATAPLRVTLAYTDKEGSTSGNAFVNNLDLEVIIGSTTYKGNVFSGANSVTGGVADTRNNLESVFLPAGLAVGTTVTILVKAFNIAGPADPTIAGPNQDFALVVYNANPGAPQAVLTLASTALTGGNGNGRIDPNECNTLNIMLQNNGTVNASVISAVLTTSTPQVSIAQGSSPYADIAAGGSQINGTPFQISTTAAAANGTTVDFTLTVTYSGGGSPRVISFSLPLGVDQSNYVFTATPAGATIPAGGTLVTGSAADDALVSVVTPFAFSVYGTAITSGQTIRVSTNGTIQFVATGGATAVTNAPLPGAALPSAVSVIPYWDDLLLTTAGGGIYTNTVGVAPNRQFIIEWRGQPYSTTVGAQSVNFAVVFNEGSNQFEFRYLQTGAAAATPNGLSATVGVQAGNTASSNFTQYSFNQSVITPGLTLSAGFPVSTPGTGACAANVPPNLAYSPTTTSAVNFTGVTTVGSVGSGAIAVTPSAGRGTGAPATSTVNGCAFSGADAANFVGAGAVNLSFVGNTTTPQNINLSCTAGGTIRSGTLTCNETLGSGAPTQRSWPLSCPLGNSPPQFGYVPATGNTVVGTGGASVGSSGALSITPSIATAGSGSGAAATTTLTCTPPTAPFSGFAQTVTATGSGVISGGPLSGNCTLGATTQSQTLSCTENRGGTATAVTWTLSCPVGNAPPNLSYNPVTAAIVGFTGVTAVGSAGSGSIAVTPSGGSGSGATATSTVNGCGVNGADAASFLGASSVNLSFVGNTATAQSIAMTCTAGSAARNAALTCNEKLGGGVTTQRSWPLSCPVGNAPPNLAYNPTTGATVAFTGVTTVGSAGSGSIAVTPSGGSGSGATATSTVNGCGVNGADAASFLGASSVNLSFVGNTATAQSIAMTCTAGSAARNAALTCNEKLGGGVTTQRSWPLSCPVGSAPPQFVYAPASGSTVPAAVGPLGTTSALSITPSLATPGSGSGAAATTTLTCTAPTAPFSGFGQSVTATGSGAISGTLSGSCTLAATVQTQTLSCNENRGGTSVPLSWTLSCPVGCSLDVNGDGTVTADKDGVLISRYLLGFRGAGLIANVPLGAARADAASVETFIGTGAQFDVFGRPVPVPTATQDSLVLIRLMLGLPDTALLGGITLPSGALFGSGSAVRANVNARCGTAY